MKIFARRWVSATVAVAAVGAVLAACSSGTGSKKSSTSASTDTLTIASDSQPISFDPSLIAPEQTSPYTDPVYDRLINEKPDGSLSPGLATQWRYTGPLTFEITLRKNIKFNDGTDMTAASVVANYTRLKTPPASGGVTASSLQELDTVKAVGEDKVVFALKSPNPSLAQVLSTPAGIIVSPQGLSDTKKLASGPSGVGPYTMNLKETVPNQKYVYDKNPDYWNATAFPYKRIVTLEILDDNARLNAIRSGQADIAMGTLSTIKAATAAGLKVNVGGSDQHDLVIMDHRGAVVPELADERVRQALSYAIDRKAFVQSVQFGYGKPSSQFLSVPSQVGFVADLNNEYPYDPVKAKQLLAESGHAAGFTFTILTEPFLEKESEALSGFFAAVGVTMKINVRTNDMVPQIKSKKFAAFQNTGTPVPSSLAFGYYMNGNILDVFNQSGTPEMANLYKQAMAATDPAEQQKQFGELNTLATKLAWKISLSTSGTPVFYRKDLNVLAYASQSEPHLIGIQPAN